MRDESNFRPHLDEPEPETIEPEPDDDATLDGDELDRRLVGPAPVAGDPALDNDELDDERSAEYREAMTNQAIVSRVWGPGFRFVRGWLPKSAGADPIDKRFGITLNGHSGWDVAVKSGTPIFALSGGVVSFANDEKVDPAGARKAAVNYGGKSVVVDLGNSTDFAYMHLSDIAVRPGQAVEPGELLGYSGSTGVSTGPHLLFGIRQNGKYVDPTAYLRGLASSAWQPPSTSRLPAFPKLPAVGAAFRPAAAASAPAPAHAVNVTGSDLIIVGALTLAALAIVVVATAGRSGGTSE